MDINAFFYPSKKSIVLAVMAALAGSELHHHGRPHIETLTYANPVSPLTSSIAASGTSTMPTTSWFG